MCQEQKEPTVPSATDRVSRRRYAREQAARQEAENLLEVKCRELVQANDALNKHAQTLDAVVRERTRDLERAKLEAEAASLAKSNFLAVMSHEIRTPLNGILGMASCLAESETSQEQTEALEVILSSGDMLLTIINDILDLAKVEAGKLELEFLPSPVDGVLAAVCQQFEVAIREKGLSFAYLPTELLAQDTLWAQLDPTRLRQVLGNLMSNALKFTETGGITLSAKAEALPLGRLHLEFSIADTGRGIAEAQQARLFQPFSQADASIARSHGGTGLGLVVSKQICQQMAGDIRFVSAAGQGSTFTVSLDVPRAEAPKEPAKPSVDTRASSYEAVLSQRRWRILVAEDSRTNQLVIRHFLRPLDLDITFVETGEEAIHHWRQTGFDLILMDVNMPVLDGLSATAVIRTEEQRRGLVPVPVIAVSANAMDHQVAAYLAKGMMAHVAKPFRRTDLIQAMGEALAAAGDLSASGCLLQNPALSTAGHPSEKGP